MKPNRTKEQFLQTHPTSRSQKVELAFGGERMTYLPNTAGETGYPQGQHSLDPKPHTSYKD
jgi:hypothetical protein